MLDTLHQTSRATFRTAPLFPVAAGMITGIMLDRWLQIHLFVYLLLFVLTGGMVMSRAVRASIGPLLVLVASLCVGGVLHLGSARVIPASSIELHFGEGTTRVRPDRRIARLRGTVASAPRVLERRPHPFERWSYRSDRTAFLLDVETVEGTEGDVLVSGLVRITVDEAVLGLRENERVEVFGWLYRMGPPRNPGSVDWAAFQRRQGVVAGMRCKHRESVRHLDDKPPTFGGDIITRLRAAVRGMLTDDLATGTDEEASLLEAMVLGHRSQLDRRLNEIFIRAGCIHFLAVSGFHLGVPMSFAWWLGRRFGQPNRRCAWLMLAAVLLYATIAEPRPPILRAAVMGTLFCFSLILRRLSARLNWLSAAAVVLVLLSPQTVFDAGFQLSFGAVVGIIFLPSSLGEFLAAFRRLYERVVSKTAVGDSDRELSDAATRGTRSRWRRMRWRLKRPGRRYILVPLAIAVSAWVASVPIVATDFQRIHLWGAIYSVVVFPFVYLLILAAFAKILVAAVVPGWGWPLTALITIVERWLIDFVDLLGSLPGATWDVSTPPWLWVISWYSFLLLFAWRFRRPAQRLDDRSGRIEYVAPPRAVWLGALCGAACAVLVFSTAAWCWPKGASDRLIVSVLSVGAGSAMVVELPDGRTVLCDAGSSSPYDVGRNTVVPFLRHQGITRIDRVYVSHPNLDHFGGIPSIVDEVETGPIVVNEYFHRRSGPTSPSRHLLDRLAEQDHPIQVLDTSEPRWKLGGVTFERLWPPGDLVEALPTNETSTVLRLTYAGHSILFTGDIEDHAQRSLVEQGNLAADVLILPHHGSVEPSTHAFIDAVGASALIRSSHERRVETFNGLYEMAGATPIYNTADVGAVRVAIDREGVRISTMRETRPANGRPGAFEGRSDRHETR